MAAELHLPHQFAGAYKTLTAQCHCKSTHFTVTVPTSALPLPVHLCHCSICRYTHGTFSCFHASLPHEVEPYFVSPSSIESSLTGYIHDKAASERFFCTTCGCHIGDRDLKVDPETGKASWRVATSIFNTHDEETFQIRSHSFVDPATEPNLATWLPSLNGRDVHVWNPAPDDPHFPLAKSRPLKPDLPDPNRLLAQCHCGGVRFTLPRPSQSDAADPFLSRFLRTGPTPSPPEPNHNPSPATTNPSATHAHAHAHARATGPPTLKRVACICICDDCRLVSGAHAVPWTFAPLGSLQPAIPPSLEGGGTTLRAYHSSERVTRAFCGVCGATVFYRVDDEERVSGPERVGDGDGGEERVVVVDVAVGLLRDWEGGVAAEGWLAWRTGRLAGMESGRRFDGGFAEGLREGLGNWGVHRYGEREEFNIPQDLP